MKSRVALDKWLREIVAKSEKCSTCTFQHGDVCFWAAQCILLGENNYKKIEKNS